MQPAQVDVSVWKFVLYVCVTGSHGNHEHGLVKIQEAPCFFKLNGYMYTYGCVCVCIYAPNHQCSSLNCWHSEFKASSFSSRQKYPDLHLFFLPALFRCPTPGAEKKNHFRPQSSKTHVKLSLDTDHLKSFDFSFRSFGVDFLKHWGWVISTGAGDLSLLALCFLPGGRPYASIV